MGKASSWKNRIEEGSRRDDDCASSPRSPPQTSASKRSMTRGRSRSRGESTGDGAGQDATRYLLRGGFQPSTQQQPFRPQTFQQPFVYTEHEGKAPRSSPKPSPKGFLNVGNSCYANAALQCLLSTALATALTNPKSAAIFRRYSSNPNILAQGSGSVDSNEDVVKEKRRSYDRRMLENCRWLTRELRSIANEYNAPHTSWFTRPVVNPGKITRHPDRLSPCLRPYQQEDAHEFLRALLSTLVLNGQNRRLSSLFDGLLESAVTCLSCHRPSLTRDRYMDLSLDICGTHVNSLDDALEEFTKTETLSGENKVFCQKCCQKRTATKGLRLATAPSILVCHLKRFAFDSYGRLVRLDKKVQIPLILEIGSYMSCLNKSTPPPYELVAVLVHQGQSCDSGHYLAYVKNNNQWYKCNDSEVEPVSVTKVLEQQAYMLLYEVEEMRSSQPTGTATPNAAPPTSWTGWKDFLQASCGVDESLLIDICWHQPVPTAQPRKPRTVRDRSIESHCSHDDLSTLGESCATVDSSQPEAWRRISSSGNLNFRSWKETPAPTLTQRNIPLPLPLPPRPTPTHHRRNSNSAYWDTRSTGARTNASTGHISYSAM
jgi:Ubiquitin carboxyl-terminal hydrolase